MAKMNSVVKFLLDAEGKTTLRATGEADVAAATTAAESAVTLDALESYWDDGVIPFVSLAAIFNVTKATGGTVALSVEVATDEAFTTPVKVAEFAGIQTSGTGVYAVYLDIDTVLKQAPGAKFARAKAVTGAGASANYNAWLAPIAKLV